MWKNSHILGSSAHARTSRSVKYLQPHGCYYLCRRNWRLSLARCFIKSSGKENHGHRNVLCKQVVRCCFAATSFQTALCCLSGTHTGRQHFQAGERTKYPCSEAVVNPTLANVICSPLAHKLAYMPVIANAAAIHILCFHRCGDLASHKQQERKDERQLLRNVAWPAAEQVLSGHTWDVKWQSGCAECLARCAHAAAGL